MLLITDAGSIPEKLCRLCSRSRIASTSSRACLRPGARQRICLGPPAAREAEAIALVRTALTQGGPAGAIIRTRAGFLAVAAVPPAYRNDVRVSAPPRLGTSVTVTVIFPAEDAVPA